MQKLITCAAIVAFAGGAAADLTDLRITEVYTGINGEDGTVDWFELTNLGGTDVSTANLWYDDSSNDAGENTMLPSITIPAGGSAVILIDAAPGDVATEIALFNDIWNYSGLIGAINPDGGSIGQGGDEVNIYTGNATGLLPFLSVDTLSTSDTNAATIEYDVFGNGSFSVDGVNGAYLSDAFFNDNEPGQGNGDSVQLIGSPGTAAIPAPGAAAVLGLAGVAGIRRRR